MPKDPDRIMEIGDTVTMPGRDTPGTIIGFRQYELAPDWTLTAADLLLPDHQIVTYNQNVLVRFRSPPQATASDNPPPVPVGQQR